MSVYRQQGERATEAEEAYEVRFDDRPMHLSFGAGGSKRTRLAAWALRKAHPHVGRSLTLREAWTGKISFDAYMDAWFKRVSRLVTLGASELGT